MKYYTLYNSPLGQLTIGCNERALTGLWLPSERYYPSLEGVEYAPDDPLLNQASCWLDQYFAGQRPAIALPLAPQGTAFQQKVWAALQTIPYGHTASYASLAVQIGSPKAYQAVGNAVGHNPLSILVPCHRVIGSGGEMTGYAGGLNAKQWLLRHEQLTAK